MNKGKPKTFSTPDELWNQFEQYMAHVRANPRKIRVYVGWDKRPEWLEKRVPLTMIGFDCWLHENGKGRGIGNYKRMKCPHHQQFDGVIRRIRLSCRADMIVGALIGEYNARIVARLLSP